jgi:hypothetical protein
MKEGDLFNKNSIYVAYYGISVTPATQIYIFTPYKNEPYAKCKLFNTNGIISMFRDHVDKKLIISDYSESSNRHQLLNTGYKELFELSDDEALNILGDLL